MEAMFKDEFSKEDILKYLNDKGIVFKETGNNQYLLKECPVCSDIKYSHFYINKDNGLWNCHKCFSKGNFYQFKEVFNDNVSKIKSNGVIFTEQPKEYKELPQNLADEYSKNLFNRDFRFLDYLEKLRGLSEKVLKEYKIGSTGAKISIPIFENGKLVNMRYRRDPDINDGSRYISETGCKTAMFNGDILNNPDVKEIFYTEGEMDTLHLIQRGLNAVSGTLGAGYFPIEWVEKFKNVEDIWVIFDSDDAGKTGAKLVVDRLGVGRCKVIELPNVDGRKKTDITDYFTTDNHSKEDFLKLMDNAKTFIKEVREEKNVKHISEFNEELRNVLVNGTVNGIFTGYGNLDREMGGFRKGRLIIVSGLTNTGKSSFCSNICLSLAMHKVSSMFFSLEMPPIDIVRKMVMQKARLSSDDLNAVKTSEEMLKRVDDTFLEFSGLPIYLYTGSGVVGYKKLEKVAREAKEKYDVKVVFIDHLHYFAQSVNNLTNETSQIVRQVKQLAVELDITIVLLAHLNRGGRTNQRTGMYVPTLADLKSSSAIEQDADQVLFVCRDSESANKAERERASIKCAKNRDGKAGWFIDAIFNEQTTTFVETVVGGEVNVVNSFINEEVVSLDKLLEDGII